MSDESSGQNLVIERTLEAPPHLVWKMWTQPERFAAWYGPAGVSIPVVRMDVRVGGTRLLCMEMTMPDGTRQLWFAGEYLEVIENKRLVYTDAMSDENGDVIATEQGGSAGHPTVTEVRVELEAVGSGTRMTLTHIGISPGSPGAVGWEMAFRKLATRLHEQGTA